ncbi:hypothetical protein Sjap_023104 [Stephania japonica]|uniref:TOG domain-containing protein n=1 Tax=Stephania japonica TaxID=461633 RepID=A0AAP0EVI7_9MAGN
MMVPSNLSHKMKANGHSKPKGGTRVNPQKAIFEQKHRVILALNKLADRDTYQIGVEDLGKIAESLTPEGLPLFLSCVIETDAEQKSAVRKECIRVLGMLARFHGDFLGPYLAKMIGSIVKRLKDPDSVVRDACVEAVGVLASVMCNQMAASEETFVLLVKPLFEALGEQNRQVQFGSALCLASVVDNAYNPPVAVLLRMLTRIVKLLKNPHFMAKPALIELVRSLIQAGGAPTKNALSPAISTLQDALKSSEWTTRKAASMGLASIALTGNPLLESLKASCVHSLESCRFDKVKPVRDSVLQALQDWRNLPSPDSPALSEAGSSTIENSCGGDGYDIAGANSGWNKGTKVIPLTARKTCQNRVHKAQNLKSNDWHVEIAVPRTLALSLADTQNEESEDSNFTKSCERPNVDTTSIQVIDCDYVPMDDKPECTSSYVVSGEVGTKHDTASNSKDLEKDALVNPTGTIHRYAVDNVGHEEICFERHQERQSMDSTVTEVSSQIRHACCSQTTNAIAFIQKQLIDIENKQTNLLNLVQGFMGITMDSLSMLQSKVLGLEHVVDKIAHDLAHGANYSDIVISKLLNKNQNVCSSPRRSTCTPRPSVDISNTRSSLLGSKNRDLLGEISTSRSSTSDRGVQMLKDPSVKNLKSFVNKGTQQCVRLEPQPTGSQTRKAENAITSFKYSASARENSFERKKNLRKCVKDFLRAGDLNSAFVEVICSGDDAVLIELIDRTGPVLERLSHEAVGEILNILAAYFLDQRFLGSIIPWLQQVVDLSNTHGADYLGLSVKEKREFLRAIQDAASMDFLNPADKRSVIQLAVRLRQVWGLLLIVFCCREILNEEREQQEFAPESE